MNGTANLNRQFDTHKPLVVYGIKNFPSALSAAITHFLNDVSLKAFALKNGQTWDFEI